MLVASAVHIEIQPELIFSLVIITAICAFCIYAGKKIKAADPLAKPSGVVLVSEIGVKMIQDYMTSIMPEKFAKNYYPYFAMMFFYLICANLSGLLGFDTPTSNYSITLAITLITFILIQYNAIKKKGGLKYTIDLVWPPTNLLGAVSPLISLSMRLFGNVLSGTILMTLVYNFTGWISNFILPVNFLGPIITPVLHMYFDVFAGCIQTLVFVTLSSILIAIEAEE